ncbi:RagB/SusD family nutrient uptake outer membrane protein [Arcticibacter tournemirensis]|uniref:RagB/SusD family nutrient uptake outer membrane protein n=1 Tax=Arcticibacter tournemirensis TaxID=699437 RepID=A0A4Q0M4X3_9SPHI|nr:RagB/SusD family nutrient uptake outer membrane protein [Arcticibacter tournemirensis]RXF68030.1 RagB/SusD family nutrient uptake outer membrane protein [Arcticibacter tournemirensis]
MKKIAHLIIAFLTFFVYGCDKFLETTPTDRISDQIVWEDKKTATLYCNTFLAYIDRYGVFSSPSQFNGNLTEGLTETFKYGSNVPGSRAGDANMIVFNPERIGPDQNLLNVWAVTYERIRRINEFLVGLKNYSKFDEQTNLLFEGQARFMRAYLYFQLAKRHDGVILYTDMNFVRDKNRSSAEETWNLIEEDLNFAASVLPQEWDSANYGRITKGAVYAFKSRAMLYAGRWQSVKDAADEVFKLNKYSLTANYKDSWKGNNSESILEYNYLVTGPNHNFDAAYATFGEVVDAGGAGAPTQEMVEAYEKADGTTIDWALWHAEAGTTVRPPYEALEPRFQATIIYNGCQWQGKTMENTVNGINGSYMDYGSAPYPKGKTTTGYYLRKLRDENHKDLNSYASAQTWVEIRLAEVYLNRAEALYRLNNATGALNDINAVRNRVSLPAKSGLTGERLFSAIRQERKIELAYEDHLYWDMRRWRLADKDYPAGYNNYRVHGLRITQNSGSYLWQYVDCDKENRKFLTKTYVLPIPNSELNNNSGIQQYDEWK